MSDFTDSKDYSLVRRVLRSEITWFVSALFGVAWFYNSVIIPINNMQIQLSSIQANLQQNASTLSSFDSRITQSSNDIIRIKQIIGDK